MSGKEGLLRALNDDMAKPRAIAAQHEAIEALYAVASVSTEVAKSALATLDGISADAKALNSEQATATAAHIRLQDASPASRLAQLKRALAGDSYPRRMWAARELRDVGSQEAKSMLIEAASIAGHPGREEAVRALRSWDRLKSSDACR